MCDYVAQRGGKVIVDKTGRVEITFDGKPTFSPTQGKVTKRPVGRPRKEIVLTPIVPVVKINSFVEKTTKKEVNIYLQRLVRDAYEGRRGRRSIKGLILDAEKANTSNALKTCFRSASCEIVSPNLEPAICEELNRLAFVKSPNCEMRECINSWEIPYNVIFLDYCGTWQGNEFSNPSDELGRVCQKVDETDRPMVVGITISTRTNKGGVNCSGMTTTQEIIDVVQASTFRSFNLLKIGYKGINTLFFQFKDNAGPWFSSSLFIKKNGDDYEYLWDDEEKEDTQGLPYIRGLERNSDFFRKMV